MRPIVFIPAILAAALYLAGAVYTSGLAWNRYDCSGPHNYGCDGQQVIATIFATTLWPFTLSAAYHGGWLK